MSRNSKSDESKLDFTFELIKNNLSKLGPEEKFWSPVYSVAEVSWKIEIGRTIDEESKKPCLSIFPHVQGKTQLWCCYARIRMSIISQVENVKDTSDNYDHLFSSVETCYGWSNFILWDELVDPKNGYIKDDSCKFRIHILADPPQNVDANDKRAPEPPKNSNDWLSVFEDKLNEKIVCRLAEEFKEITNLSKEEFEKVHTLQRDIDTLQEDIDVVKEDTDTIKGEIEEVKIDLVSVKEGVNIVKGAVDELKNLLSKRDENSVDPVKGKVEASNEEEINKDQKDSFESEAVIKDFVVKILNDFKSQMKRECFSHQNTGNRILCCTSPWYVNNEPCVPHPPYECRHKSKSYNHLCSQFSYPCETAPYDQFEFVSHRKKRPRNELGCSISSSSSTHYFREFEKFLEKGDENESDSTDTSHNVFVQPPPVTHPSIPNEEEALLKNMDLNAPWRKDLFLTGKDEDGKQETHKVTYLKELFDLKKKFKECQVFEAERIQMQ